jgi:RNA polymerase sigma factor (sigma-70 family)
VGIIWRLTLLIFLVFQGGPGVNASASAQSTAEVFSGLYEKYMPKVYHFVSFRVEDKVMAEDITSAVFEKALSKFTSYDPQKANFPTWIFSIARNTLIDHYRGRSQEQKYQKEAKVQIMVFSTTPEKDASRSEDIRKLRLCLSRLKQNEQEIITLKFTSEMTNREIAKVTGLSESNVGTILCRVVKKLRDGFTGWQHE